MAGMRTVVEAIATLATAWALVCAASSLENGHTFESIPRAR
jgi:hypothetical protein